MDEMNIFAVRVMMSEHFPLFALIWHTMLACPDRFPDYPKKWIIFLTNVTESDYSLLYFLEGEVFRQDDFVFLLVLWKNEVSMAKTNTHTTVYPVPIGVEGRRSRNVTQKVIPGFNTIYSYHRHLRHSRNRLHTL